MVPSSPHRPRAFFLNATATTQIYTLSLHDALPISARRSRAPVSNLPLAVAPAEASLERSPARVGHNNARHVGQALCSSLTEAAAHHPCSRAGARCVAPPDGAVGFGVPPPVRPLRCRSRFLPRAPRRQEPLLQSPVLSGAARAAQSTVPGRLRPSVAA